MNKSTHSGLPRGLAAAFILTLALTASVFSQELATARVPVKVNVAASVSVSPSVGAKGSGASKYFEANVWDTLTFSFAKGDPFEHYISNTPPSSVLPGRRMAGAGAMIRQSHGSVTLNLQPERYDNAAIALYSVNGKRILNGRAAASRGASSISNANIPAGVYLLSVKGVKGSSFTTRLSHRGGRLNIDVAFADAAASLRKQAAEYGETWVVTASAAGHSAAEATFVAVEGLNPPVELTLKALPAKSSFTETVGGVTFNMVFVAGGAFTLGCETSDGCPANTSPVSAEVSDYFIGETEVTKALWWAVMGNSIRQVMDTVPTVSCYQGRCWPDPSGANGSVTTTTWYDAQEFACKLSEMTGKNYRMMTEAEFEFAAKQRQALGLQRINESEEWAYNTWSNTHSSGKDPLGPGGPIHNQKTRRDAADTEDNITGRLIRSIEGRGPAMRLVLSADRDFPPDMVSPCKIIAPAIDDGTEINSYRDRRWITGDHYEWAGGFGGGSGSSSVIKVWEDGAARVLGTSGEWYTVNNFAFKVVSSSGARTKFAYIFVSPDEVSLIPAGTTGGSGGIGGMMPPVGRFTRRPATVAVNRPSNFPGTPVEQLIELPEDQMWDMGNIPEEAKGQDERLLDGANEGWWQENRDYTHRYRKDVTRDDFRFIVYGADGDGFTVLLAGGEWFTVNNTFLRVKFHGGHVADYLYSVMPATSGGGFSQPETFYHVSYIDYERGDFRSFVKTPNAGVTGFTNEIPASSTVTGGFGQGQIMAPYGTSTYAPPRCPAGGC